MDADRSNGGMPERQSVLRFGTWLKSANCCLCWHPWQRSRSHSQRQRHPIRQTWQTTSVQARRCTTALGAVLPASRKPDCSAMQPTHFPTWNAQNPRSFRFKRQPVKQPRFVLIPPGFFKTASAEKEFKASSNSRCGHPCQPVLNPWRVQTWP